MTQAMNLYMPILMGYLALTFASGLALYFVASNLVSIIQYGAMGRLQLGNLFPSKKEEDQQPKEAKKAKGEGKKA